MRVNLDAGCFCRAHKVNKESLPSKVSRRDVEISYLFFFFSSMCFVSFYCAGCSQSWDTVSQCLSTTRTHKNTLLGSFARFMSFLRVCVCLRVCVSNKSLPELSSQVVFVHFLQVACAATASSSALAVVSEGSELFSILPFSLSHPLMTINLHLASLGCINQTG